MNVVAEDADVTLDQERLKDDIDDFVAFEVEFARVMSDDESRRDPNQQYNLRTLEELSKLNEAV